MNPSSNVGSIEYTARISTDKLKQDARSVDSITHKAGSVMGDNLEQGESRVSKAFGSVIGKVKAAAIATTAVLTAAGTAATTFGLKSAADFEQTRIGIENMLGSADKARSLLSDISDFAADTPFEFPELAGATRQLIAFGFSGEDAFNTMKQLGDVSAAVGAPVGDLAYLMGTLRTQGRAFTIDIRQFAQRGIPIYEYLAKVLKTNEKAISGMIEEGKIGFPEVQKAFQLMTAEGGKFYKTMDKQSQSLSGQFSTLKDNLGQTLRELVGISKTGDVIQGSLFDKVRQGVANVNASLPDMSIKFQSAIKDLLPVLKQWADNVVNAGDRIQNYLGPKVGGLISVVRLEFLPAILEFVKAIGPQAGAGLVWALGLAIDTAKLTLEFFTPLINFLSDNTWIIWGLATAFVAVKTAMFIDGAVKSFTAALSILNAAVAVSTAVVGGAGGAATGLRLALLLLTNPWVIGVTIVGVAAVLVAIDQMNKAFKKIGDQIDDLNRKEVNIPIGGGGEIKTSGGSGLGLTQQIRRAFGFRAEGGPVSAGQPYIVGERQPEVFVPRTSGTILPDVGDAVGGGSVSITVNMDGIMARSRTDMRFIAKDLIESINEELRAKGKKQIGDGALGATA